MGRTFNVLHNILAATSSRRAAGGGLSLPFFINFDGDTIGQAPAGWTDNGAGLAPVIIDSMTDGAYDPERNCLHLRNDASNHCDCEKALGGSLPASFRMAYWSRCQAPNGEDAHKTLLKNTDGKWFYQQFKYHASNTWRTLTRENGVDNVWLYDDTNMSQGGLSWSRYTVEFDNATQTVKAWIYNCASPGTLRFYGAKDFSAEVDWTAAGLTTLNPYNNNAINQYSDEVYYLGFWFGALTDSWPAVVMP